VAALRNPGLIKERTSAVSSARGFERFIILLVLMLCAAIVFIGALDAGRFHWTSVPASFKALGWVMVFPAFALPFWVGIVNTYASVVVRVQKERGHQVITVGPYRYIRHPMYTGTVLLGVSVPLALGSWWALVPGLLFSVTFVLRTAQEDGVLQRRLSGYAEYASKTRYRLIPGVW
jgi:protein-S-isoprenylcysteine O-methyltransferase Ste14